MGVTSWAEAGRLSPIGRLAARSRRPMVIEVPDHVTPLA
ncbi:MAG: hypothetical protein JWR83_3481 [Aeromicrobium sp.]|nr:hypothetical protein [Aeromicrobium sp.]